MQNSQVTVFKQQNVLSKNFRVFGSIDEPLFLAKDVAEWIEHSDVSTMIRSVDDDEKVTNIVCTLGGNQEAWFLTEDGLYEILMQSRKPIAKAFKKEVKKILRDIRLYGSYSVPRTYVEALQLAVEQQRMIEQQNQLIGELKPRVDYLDRILKSKSLVTITQIAKDYGMSGSAMNRLLHELGIQFKQSDQWLLYQKYHDKGYTFSETFTIEDVPGLSKVVMQTKWTQKGRVFLYNLLKSNGYQPTIERSQNDAKQK
jgi:anti-repressor protein